jgi:hypothetical protein
MSAHLVRASRATFLVGRETELVPARRRPVRPVGLRFLAPAHRTSVRAHAILDILDALRSAAPRVVCAVT